MSFQRSYSRVFYGNDEMKFPLMNAASTATTISDRNNASPNLYIKHHNFPSMAMQHNMSNIAEESMSFERSARPGSLRSHDSGFNDSDHSPNTSSNSSQLLDNNNVTSAADSPTTAAGHNCHQTTNNNSHVERSPSICSESTQTPPTVIRKKLSSLLISPSVRRISFSAPNTPDANENKSNRFGDSFTSMGSMRLPNETKSSSSTNSSSSNDSPLNKSRSGSKSLRRAKVISPHNNSEYRRRRLLNCVSRVSDSVGDVYTLASESTAAADDVLRSRSLERNALHHSYESLTEVKRIVQEIESESSYNNETVEFGCGDDEVAAVMENRSKSPRPKLPLPSYDDLYPPTGSSTPKMTKASHIKKADYSQASIAAMKSDFVEEKTPNRSHGKPLNEFDWDLSLTGTMNWDTCTYIEYTNPQLNGHASSVHFWLDEVRTTFAHEILSTLQTKSILFEAARTLSMNPAIASKLISQIQIKAIDIETSFEQIERVFESHAKRLKIYAEASEDDVEIADNKFKATVSTQMKQLSTTICQFMRKLNSKIIFQSTRASTSTTARSRELKHFELNVKTVIEMCQDFRVACDTKIDDIEVNCLLKDLLSLKQNILKVIRKVFRRLVSIIAIAMEETDHELLLRSYINMIATLPAEGVYNSSERFSSLNDAFLSRGIIRILLLLCIDSVRMTVRALALRALATICASSEMIQQFMEIGGLDVVTDIITDAKRASVTFEPELREAVSVLTQVTAPWHHSSNCRNIDDLLKLSIDNVVTRLTNLITTTECTQTLMLCIACLNNLSRKSMLTFYSLMGNQTINRIVRACDKHQECPANFEFTASIIFLYEQITGMIFNMAGNKKCHQHLADKDIINFLTYIFQTQFHVKYPNWTESAALKKTVKNILHIFARLIHHSAMGHDLLEHNVIPIFSRVEQLNGDASGAYAKDMMYINKKLNNSFGRSPFKPTVMYDANNNSIASKGHNECGDGNAANETCERRQRRLSLCNVTGSTVLESYV